jgi:hypothetical protein
MAQTTLRIVCGQGELDELLSQREKINRQLQGILDEHTDPWGIKVSAVEVKHIDLPQDMQRAMARQAKAEREGCVMVINAEGGHQAANRLAEAARIISEHPIALQLSYLQTLREVAAQGKSTTLFPTPIDLFRPFLQSEENLEKYRKKAVAPDCAPATTGAGCREQGGQDSTGVGRDNFRLSITSLPKGLVCKYSASCPWPRTDSRGRLQWEGSTLTAQFHPGDLLHVVHLARISCSPQCTQ